MITDNFFKRFTTDELNQMSDYINQLKTERRTQPPASIKTSSISLRTRTILANQKLEQWEQLKCYSIAEIEHFKGIKPKNVKEILAQMHIRGLKSKGS